MINNTINKLGFAPRRYGPVADRQKEFENVFEAGVFEDNVFEFIVS